MQEKEINYLENLDENKKRKSVSGLCYAAYLLQ